MVKLATIKTIKDDCAKHGTTIGTVNALPYSYYNLQFSFCRYARRLNVDTNLLGVLVIVLLRANN